MIKLIPVVLLALSTSVFAATQGYVDVSKLTKEQQAEIQLQVEKTVAAAANPSKLAVTVREEASAWADLGKNVGTALVASAKEVGQGVNEFLQTPVGKVTTAIIVYKVIGKDLLALVFGTLTLIVGTIIAIAVYRNLGVSQREYEHIPRLGGLWVSTKIKKFYRDEDWVFGSAFVGAIILIVTWVTGLNLIF